MARQRWGDLAFGSAVHLARFGIIILALWVAPAFGITGWYQGLFANVLCSLFAIGLVTYLRLWRRIGFLVAWRSWLAAALLLFPLSEALIWIAPAGLVELPSGMGLWALTLLLVGFNEELISRGVVLERLRHSFPPLAAVALTGALFGLQHLSAFATTSRDAVDILGNVLVSGFVGFALAAFQWRFAWIWPLMIIHALADFTAIHAVAGLGDWIIAVTVVGYLVFGLLIIRAAPRPRPDGSQFSRHDNDPGVSH